MVPQFQTISHAHAILSQVIHSSPLQLHMTASPAVSERLGQTIQTSLVWKHKYELSGRSFSRWPTVRVHVSALRQPWKTLPWMQMSNNYLANFDGYHNLCCSWEKWETTWRGGGAGWFENVREPIEVMKVGLAVLKSSSCCIKHAKNSKTKYLKCGRLKIPRCLLVSAYSLSGKCGIISDTTKSKALFRNQDVVQDEGESVSSMSVVHRCMNKSYRKLAELTLTCSLKRFLRFTLA